MNKATTAQVRRIWGLAGERGMDSDLLHAYIEALIGKDSIKLLSIVEAIQVIKGLSGKETRSNQAAKEVLSKKQKKYILYLASELGWVKDGQEVDMQRVEGFCRKQYGALYLEAMSRSQACRCIEAMKEMITRNGRQGKIK